MSEENAMRARVKKECLKCSNYTALDKLTKERDALKEMLQSILDNKQRRYADTLYWGIPNEIIGKAGAVLKEVE
jgi:hypothetical protein